ncbi:MAG: hypothetical protein ACO3NL_00895 [Phycisphaerales bacterium]
MQPRKGRFTLPEIAEFARQIAYAPPATRRRQMDRLERLVGEIDPAIRYPFGFVVYRTSGYRPETDGSLLEGGVLRRDLAQLVLAISEGLDLATTERPDSITLEDAATTLSVSGRTIHRWRSEGMIVHRVRVADGSRRLSVDRRELERYAGGRGLVPGAAQGRSRIGDGEGRRIEERFKSLRGEGLPPTAAARRIAEELGRSREAVRKRLIASGSWRRRMVSMSAERFRCRLLAAFDRLIPPGEFASRHGRDAKSAEAECRRLRVARLRQLTIPSRRFPTFDRADAAKVIPATPAAQRGFLDQWMPSDAVALVAAASARRLPRGFESEAEALLAVEAWLLEEVAARLESLAAREASLDEVEWRLRWALSIRRRVARRLLPIVISRIEQALGGSLLARTAGEIRRLLGLGLATLAEVLDRFEPATRSGPSRSLRGVLALAVDRAVAREIESMPSRRAAARHRAIPWEDPSPLLAPWALPVLGPDRWRDRAAALPEGLRVLLERRHGWAETRPCSLAELAREDGVPLSRIARRLREAHRSVRSVRSLRG